LHACARHAIGCCSLLVGPFGEAVGWETPHPRACPRLRRRRSSHSPAAPAGGRSEGVVLPDLIVVWQKPSPLTAIACGWAWPPRSRGDRRL